jgi:hypothetical protein
MITLLGFYSTKFDIYITQTNSPLFRKKEEKQVKERVTPEFCGYQKRNFIPPNSGCYKSNPLNRISSRDSRGGYQE